jgi:hypothetical protein
VILRRISYASRMIDAIDPTRLVGRHEELTP